MMRKMRRGSERQSQRAINRMIDEDGKKRSASDYWKPAKGGVMSRAHRDPKTA